MYAIETLEAAAVQPQYWRLLDEATTWEWVWAALQAQSDLAECSVYDWPVGHEVARLKEAAVQRLVAYGASLVAEA